MIDYVQGKIAELNPTYAVLDVQGIGYCLNISLTTYSSLTGQTEAKLYAHEVIREDEHLLYGFLSKGEREIFRLLISVSGVGPNTARLLLSSFSAAELRQVVALGDSKKIAQVKGLGPKSAQRIVVDLKDKVLKVEMEDGPEIPGLEVVDDGLRSSAVAALVMLGYSQAPAQKAVNKIVSQAPDASVEAIIKQALRML